MWYENVIDCQKRFYFSITYLVCFRFDFFAIFDHTRYLCLFLKWESGRYLCVFYWAEARYLCCDISLFYSLLFCFLSFYNWRESEELAVDIYLTVSDSDSTCGKLESNMEILSSSLRSCSIILCLTFIYSIHIGQIEIVLYKLTWKIKLCYSSK